MEVFKPIVIGSIVIGRTNISSYFTNKKYLFAVNREKLKENLKKINNRPKNSAITINSLGNFLYIVKESNSFYCLLIPAKPIDILKVRHLADYGFVEKFEGINYHREFSSKQQDQIIQVVASIFEEVLKVNKLRRWRFEINNGMIGLKMHEPLLTIYQRRQINFEQYSKLSYKIKTFIFSKLSISILTFFYSCFFLKLAIPQVSFFLVILFSAFVSVFTHYIYNSRNRFKKK